MPLEIRLALSHRRSTDWQPGEPDCRRCGYRLSGLVAADRCPECGREVSAGRGRVIAEPRWSSRKRFVAAALAASLVAITAYFSLCHAQTRGALTDDPVA